MKKIILILFCFIINLTFFANDFHTYEMELVTTFSIGEKIGHLMTDINSPSDQGPSAFAFDKDNNLYICDILQRKLVVYDDNFQYKKEILNAYSGTARQIFINGNNIISYYHSAFAMEDINGNKNYFISLENLVDKKEIPATPSFIYINNIAFIRLKSGSFVGIENPGLQNVRKKVVEVKKLLDNRKKKVFSEMKLDNKNRLFLNGELLNTDYQSFISFHKEKRNLNNQSHKIKLSYDIAKLKSTKFLGMDFDKNYYFSVGFKWIYIFDKNGILLDLFDFDSQKSKIYPTIHPSGDVYFLDYDKKQVYLYRIHPLIIDIVDDIIIKK